MGKFNVAVPESPARLKSGREMEINGKDFPVGMSKLYYRIVVVLYHKSK